jgi:hypothetical protein
VRRESKFAGPADRRRSDSRYGHFIGVVEELYEPPVETLPFFLVAYDEDGQEVARRKLEAVGLD